MLIYALIDDGILPKSTFTGPAQSSKQDRAGTNPLYHYTIKMSSISKSLRIAIRPRGQYRAATSISRGQAPLPMPPNQPREDYVAPTLYTLSYISRALKLVLYTALGLGAAGLASYEGMHLYIENALLKAPYPGWEETHQSWTGEHGGTSSKLGWRGRHALRGAYLLQEHGSGSARGSIGEGGVNGVDRGYDEAREYLRVAIDEARKKGLVFPGEGQADREALDLVLLKAGVLERIATPATLNEAQSLYQDVFSASTDTAQKMRLCAKIGDVAQRTGGDGKDWWLRGLALAGVDVETSSTSVPTPEVKETRGWFGSKTTTTAPPAPPSPSSIPIPIDLPEQTRRLALTLLVSLEASLATSSSFSAATSIQNKALALIPISTGTDLNSTWLAHRRALLTLHQASVAHASKDADRALALAESAQIAADAVLTAVPDQDSAPGKQLYKDAVSLAAEAAYTRGVLVERSGKDLEQARDYFERARTLSGADAETEARAGAEGAAGQGGKYWRAWARVQGKIDGTA